MRLLPPVGSLAAVAAAALAVTGCGEEQVRDAGPSTSTPEVAITASYPGYAPFALITYRDEDGRRCHGIGTLTASGPKVLGANSDQTLIQGLQARGKCLRATDGDVSLQVRQGGAHTPRIVGGLAREGVLRVSVAGQRVRPQPNGAFLVIQPADTGPVGDKVGLEYRAGHTRRLPIRRVAS